MIVLFRDRMVGFQTFRLGRHGSNSVGYEMGSFQGGDFEVSVVKVKGKMRIGIKLLFGD